MRRFTSWIKSLFLRRQESMADSMRDANTRASEQGASGFDPLTDDYYRYLQSESRKSERNLKNYRRRDWLEEPLSHRFIGFEDDEGARG